MKIPASAAVQRRIARVVLMIIATGVVAGCGDGSDSKESAAVYQDQQLQLGLPAGSPLLGTISELCREWGRRSGATVEVVEHPVEQLEADAATAYRADDVLIYPPWAIGTLAEGGALVPVPQSVLEDEELQWDQIYVALRTRGCVWGEQVMAVPLSTPTLVCYYRRDVLDRHGIEPPRTWEEYFAIAKQLRDLSHSPEGGGGPSAIAEPLGTDARCIVFLSRAAAYAKHPDNFSFLFNVRTMEPLIAQAGFVRALEDLLAARDAGPIDEQVHQRIEVWIEAEGRNRYGDPPDTAYAGGTPLFDPQTGKSRDRDEYVLRRHPALREALHYTPADVRRALWEGRAALGLAWEVADTPLAGDGLPESASIEVLPLPGSPSVFDVSHGGWVEELEVPNRPGYFGFAGHWISTAASSKHAGAAWSLVRFLAINEISSPHIGQGRDLAPYRTSHTSQPAGWIGRDLAFSQSANYFQAVGRALGTGDVVLALRIPGSRRYLKALDAGLENALLGRAAPEAALKEVADKWREITEQIGKQSQRNSYRKSMGLAPLR